jgi:hypothetical protein
VRSGQSHSIKMDSLALTRVPPLVNVRWYTSAHHPVEIVGVEVADDAG